MRLPRRLSSVERRRSIGLSYANAGLWGLGNGLASSTLVIYLAAELGAPRIGLGVALMRAMPQIVGLLRLSAPSLIGRLIDRKRFCIGSYRLSAALLLSLPLIAAPGWLPTAELSLWALVGLWSMYHLMEYLGTVALWAWLADLVPLRVRGAFIGKRNLWLLWGGIAGMLASGGLTEVWRETHQRHDAWIGYAIAAGIGAAAMLGATLPLGRMTAAVRASRLAQPSVLGSILRPFADGRYWRLLVVGICLSLVNGITQSAQFLYPRNVLLLGVLAMHGLAVMMELGQSAVSPTLGRLIDRIGNRPVLIGCQGVVALGPLFYVIATPAAPWWIVGAWIAWIAFAGLNIGLPSLMLKLAPPGDRPAYVATYFALTGVAYAASTIAGGTLLDAFGAPTTLIALAGLEWTYFELTLLAGGIGRGLCAVLMFLILVDPAPRRDPDGR